MKKKPGQQTLRVLAPAVVLIGLVAAALPAGAQKLKVEEVVAKHQESIGAAEARASIQNRLADGATEVVFRLGGMGALSGRGQILSEGRKLSMAFAFGTSEYPGEQVVCNGDKVDVGQFRPGQRSSLSAFLFSYDVIAKEGLLGGVISTAWPLLDKEIRQAKLQYSGLKKIEGKQLHEVRYRAKKGQPELQVSLYFDSETFRHVRTQYRLIRPAGMASDPTLSSAQVDTVYTLTEVFDKFAEVDGLMLPQWTRLDLTIDAQNATVMTRWSFTVTSIAHNQQIDPKSFTIR